MKCCFWVAAALALVWLPAVSSLAQIPAEPDLVPPGPGAPPVAAPVADTNAAPVAPPPAPPVAPPPAPPVAPPAAPPAEPPAGVETNAAVTAPLEPLPVEPAPPTRPDVSTFSETQPEPFDIDRSSQYPPREPPAVSLPGPDVTGWPNVPVRKRSFWEWLLGREPAPGPAPVPGVEPVEVPVVQPPLPVGKTPETPEELVAAREDVRRQAKEIEGLKCLDLAYQAMGQNDFEEALKLFDRALTNMPPRPYTVDTRNKARNAQARCEYRLAMKYYKQKNYPEAARHANRAVELARNDKDAQQLKERIAQAEAVQRVRKPPEVSATPRLTWVPKKQRNVLRFEKEYVDKQDKIKKAINRGRQFMAMHEYEKAVKEFNSVLLIDDLNEEATANLRKIAETGYDLESKKFERVKVEMITQVRNKWSPPVKEDFSLPKPKPQQDLSFDTKKQDLIKKLNSIVIPSLDFRDANIADVVKYLDKQAIIADTNSLPGQKGVNIMLKLPQPATGTAPPPPPGTEILPPEGGAEPPAGTAGIPRVTLTLRNVVLLEAIKYITSITGLKYRIESNVVLITPVNVVEGEVISRTYRVQPNLGELIRSSTTTPAPIAPGPIGDLTPTPPPPPGGDVKKFFVDAGVPFPDGTTIKYQPSLNLLLVANTVENLEKFEEVLKQLNVIPSQVEIEARFVEIAQTDLEELGIEWLLTDNWEIAQDASAGAAVPVSARPRVQVNKNSFTKGLRQLDNVSGSASPGGSLAGILSISSILTNPELSMILHLIDQRSGANLLSAPKVTTKSGANAEIKIVKELIYPTEWSSQATTVGGSLNGITAVVTQPTAFATRDTGVILNVTPVVGPDGYTIDLTLMPQVVDLADWINYGNATEDAEGNITQVNMPQPIFHSRSLTTSISIWDGQTVVMGGMITENQSTTEDKIPFFGDIPLVGYLFKSKTSKSEKRNLLIFVTATLVDPAGNRINPKGIPGWSSPPSPPSTPPPSGP